MQSVIVQVQVWFPVRGLGGKHLPAHFLSVALRGDPAEGVKIYERVFRDMQTESFKLKQNLWCYDAPGELLTGGQGFSVDQYQWWWSQLSSCKQVIIWSLVSVIIMIADLSMISQTNHSLIICFSPSSERVEIFFVLVPIQSLSQPTTSSHQEEESMAF